MDQISIKLHSYQASGHYNEVLAATIDNPEFSPEPAAVPWIIASLSFLGRSAEAEGLYESYLGKLEVPDQLAARFFFGLTVCRERRTVAARTLFLKNLKEGDRWLADNIKNPSVDVTNETVEQVKFFMYQGLAFYRYTTGYFRQANFWIHKAVKAATAGNYVYGGALAHELSGHIQLQSGGIRSGLKSLDISAAKAQRLGQGALTQTFSASKRLYRATYGLSDADQIVTELNDALFKCRYEDSYTKASLYVQLAKIMTLRGDLKEASHLLDLASPLVFQVDNPYLETVYNLGLATVQMQRGSYSIALTIARNASERANERTHIPSLIKALGLQSVILDKLSMHRERTNVLTTLRALTRKTGGYIAQRVLARHELSDIHFRRGEDPLGDLIDDIHLNHAGATDDIFRSGWTGLLRQALDIGPEQQLIVFDLQPGSLTVFSSGQVEHKSEGCSHLIKKLLHTLASSGDLSKEELTAKLWGQTYNPLRHDALIYGLIARTRKLMSPYANWIEVSEVGYRLHESVKVKNGLTAFRQPAPNVASSAEPAVEEDTHQDEGTDIDAIMTHLNMRQIEVIKWADGGEKIQPKDLVIRLKVSDATASRDLTKLVELGAIKRFGSGRATYYCSNTNQETL